MNPEPEANEVYASMGGDNVHEILLPLKYAPLPWQTHPIDTVQQPQGWGPFHGPYMPVNFLSPATQMAGGSGINTSWTQGDNNWNHAPGYAVETVFPDRSGGFVNNVLDILTGGANGVGDPSKIYSSTISNGTQVGPGAASSFFSRLRESLGG